MGSSRSEHISWGTYDYYGEDSCYLWFVLIQKSFFNIFIYFQESLNEQKKN